MRRLRRSRGHAKMIAAGTGLLRLVASESKNILETDTVRLEQAEELPLREMGW